MSFFDPRTFQTRHLVRRDAIQLAEGAAPVEIADYAEKGLLHFIGLLCDSRLLELLVQLDNMPEPTAYISIDRLGDLSFDEELFYHFRLTRWDLVASRFAVVYESSPPEPYRDRFRFVIRNPQGSGVATMNVFWTEVKRIIWCPSSSREG